MQNEKVISLRQDKPNAYDTFFMNEANWQHEAVKRKERERAMQSAHAKAERRHRLLMGALVVATWIGTLLWALSV